MSHYDKFQIGIEFEFHSELDTTKLGKILEKELNKKITVSKTYHSEIPVNQEEFKIEPDFSGGKKLVELITGPLPYKEARLIIRKVTDVIKKKGSTDDKCSIHLNISMIDKGVKEFNQIFNITKFILNFDEDFIYKRFPSRKNSIYAKSIKEIYPKNEYVNNFIPGFIDSQVHTPNTKYYGVNFKKLKSNYLEFRYLGGEDWHLKLNEIYECMNYMIDTLFECINYPEFNDKNREELHKIINKYQKIRKSVSSYEEFSLNYQGVKILTDLVSDANRHQFKWSQIKNSLFDLLVNTDFKEGELNWDSARSRLQVKKATIKRSYDVKDIDFIGCKLSGNFTNCHIQKCELMESNLFNCTVENSKVESSKIKSTECNEKVKAIRCYVDNGDIPFYGDLVEGVFRSGKMSSKTKLGKEVEVISYTLEKEEQKEPRRNNFFTL